MTDGPSLIGRQMAAVELRDFPLEEFHRRRHRKQRNRRITTSVLGVLLLGALAGGVLNALADDDQTVDSTVLGPLDSVFEGRWSSVDVDGSSQTMVIERVDGDEHEIVILDDAATVCGGSPSTMTGLGPVRTLSELVIDAEITCDDGTEPVLTDRDADLLASLLFIHDPDTDELADSTGVRWARDGARAPILQGPSPFEGTWAVGIAGSYFPDSMEIRRVGGEDLHEVTMLKAETPQCDGGPSTMTGTGRREVDRQQDPGLVRLAVVFDLICDQGGDPAAQSPQEEGAFEDLGITFVHDPETDQVLGSLGSLFFREGAELAQGDPMATVEGMIAAVDAGDAAAFVDLFAPDGAYEERDNFTFSVSDGRGAPEEEFAEAWMAATEAWGFSAEIISCTTDPVEPLNVGPATDGWIECEVASRWAKLSLEVTERWQFELRGERLVYWQPAAAVADAPAPELPLGRAGLEEWERWLAANHPDDAARWLTPASEGRGTWMINGLEYGPTRLVPYDPAFADAIEASIREYLDGR